MRSKVDQQFVNKLICTDCLAGIRLLPDCCVPSTICSPPYDNLRCYGGHAFDFEAVARELFRITEDGGVVCWVTGEQTDGVQSGSSSYQRLYFQKIGFGLHDRIYVVQRAGCRNQRSKGYANVVQEAFILAKGTPRYIHVLRDRRNVNAGESVKRSHRNLDGSRAYDIVPDKVIQPYGARVNVWEYDVGLNKSTRDKFAYEHPALMCEALAEDLIICYSRPGDLVFDPFSGAATTAKMAIINFRRFLGFEIHEPYHNIGLRRIAVGYAVRRRKLNEEFGSDAAPRNRRIILPPSSLLDEELKKKYQLFRTPPHITQAVLRLEDIQGSVLEPCAGMGDLVREILGLPHVQVAWSDIYDWGFPQTTIRDVFTIVGEHYDCLVTNPPHGQPAAFIRHAKTLADKVIVLAPLDIEYNVTSSDLRNDREYPLKAVYAFTQAIPWIDEPRAGKIKYAWFVFQRGYRRPTIRKAITFVDGDMKVE